VLIDCLWTQQSGFALSEQCGIRHPENYHDDWTPCTQSQGEQAPLLNDIRDDRSFYAGSGPRPWQVSLKVLAVLY
jgi:hypothetical protein